MGLLCRRGRSCLSSCQLVRKPDCQLLAVVWDAGPVEGDGGAVDDAGLVAAEEEDYVGQIFRLGPGGEVRGGHGFAIGFGVDDIGEHGVDADSSAHEVCGQ